MVLKYDFNNRYRAKAYLSYIGLGMYMYTYKHMYACTSDTHVPLTVAAQHYHARRAVEHCVTGGWFRQLIDATLATGARCKR